MVAVHMGDEYPLDGIDRGAAADKVLYSLCAHIDEISSVADLYHGAGAAAAGLRDTVAGADENYSYAHNVSFPEYMDFTCNIIHQIRRFVK